MTSSADWAMITFLALMMSRALMLSSVESVKYGMLRACDGEADWGEERGTGRGERRTGDSPAWLGH